MADFLEVIPYGILRDLAGNLIDLEGRGILQGLHGPMIGRKERQQVPTSIPEHPQGIKIPIPMVLDGSDPKRDGGFGILDRNFEIYYAEPGFNLVDHIPTYE